MENENPCRYCQLAKTSDENCENNEDRHSCSCHDFSLSGIDELDVSDRNPRRESTDGNDHLANVRDKARRRNYTECVTLNEKQRLLQKDEIDLSTVTTKTSVWASCSFPKISELKCANPHNNNDVITRHPDGSMSSVGTLVPTKDSDLNENCLDEQPHAPEDVSGHKTDFSTYSGSTCTGNCNDMISNFIFKEVVDSLEYELVHQSSRHPNEAYLKDSEYHYNAKLPVLQEVEEEGVGGSRAFRYGRFDVRLVNIENTSTAVGRDVIKRNSSYEKALETDSMDTIEESVDKNRNGCKRSQIKSPDSHVNGSSSLYSLWMKISPFKKQSTEYKKKLIHVDELDKHGKSVLMPASTEEEDEAKSKAFVIVGDEADDDSESMSSHNYVINSMTEVVLSPEAVSSQAALFQQDKPKKKKWRLCSCIKH